MLGKSNTDITYKEILQKVSELDLLGYYVGITKVPCVINSPFRKDSNPSFGFQYHQNKVYYKDFSTKESGDIITFLQKLWKCSYKQCLTKILKDIPKINPNNCEYKLTASQKVYVKTATKIDCKIRSFNGDDKQYWEQFGITLDMLKKANVYPISHIFFDNGIINIKKADKLAYVFLEYKDNIVYKKIYQPLNKKGYKWLSKFDGSVISLWTTIPKEGKILVVCSSVKDALCLRAATNIPTISLQGEGYNINETPLRQLKERFDYVFIVYDNDEAGIADSLKLAQRTGFINIVLPSFEGKDIAELYQTKGKKEFIQIINSLLKPHINNGKS